MSICNRCDEKLPDPLNPFIGGHVCLPPVRLEVVRGPLRGLSFQVGTIMPILDAVISALVEATRWVRKKVSP